MVYYLYFQVIGDPIRIQLISINVRLFLIVACIYIYLIYIHYLYTIYIQQRGNMDSNCDLGYKGPLCQTCDPVNNVQYAKFDGKQCQKCYSQVTEYFIVILSVIAFIVINMVLLK